MPGTTCPSCGRENPEGFRFCGYCAAALTGEAAPVAEERKVVTVLFCDLVGFTARSDRADPEDVKATLRPFHARLKREIEAFGGTLDKFIGDAALGVFGSPVSHEDDAERAVRAALAIQAAMSELDDSRPGLELQVRQGINTGEAVVSHGAGPQIGEAVTGDVVNTASRLQSVAAAGTIVVGEATYEATRHTVEYERLEPVSVKGKAEPLRLWRAVGVDAGPSVGSAARGHTAPLIGRTDELAELRRAFDRASGESTVVLVTLIGEPGVGKSRLVAELAARVRDLPQPIPWLRGRCLPYGEGITFWALGEIVKARAGIMESDPPDRALSKLDAVLSTAESDRQWMRRRLSPLVGLDAVAAEREETFTAWRRFLESVASAGPAVFVFEDIHWADRALLDFVVHVAAESTGSPMLLLCTARPELLDREPEWSTGSNAERVLLAPLSADETASLVEGLLDQASLPPELQAVLLERAGGNPLYAEEFVGMMRDQGSLVASPDGAGWALAPGADVRVPHSIQSLIAARLDALPPSRKPVLQDASVIGRVFWAGGVTAVGSADPASVMEALDELGRKELIRRAETSTIEREVEFDFRHALVREVSYGQIPRSARASKHQAAARWIEMVTGERVEDLAEVVAHHYTTALELTRAAGGPGSAVVDLEAAARRVLVMAGDRALALDVSRAERHFADALALAPPGHDDRPGILARWADAVRQLGRPPEAAQALEEAVEGFMAAGDPLASGRAMTTLASVLHIMGSARQEQVAVEAVRLLESERPGPDLVAAYARMAGVHLVRGDAAATIEWAERAVDLSTRLGLEAPARALGFRGYARCSMGDPEGIDDMQAALAAALARGEARDAAVLYNNLAVAVSPIGGPPRVLEVLRAGIEFSERVGIREFAVAMSSARLDQLEDAGEWDAAMEAAASLAEESAATGDVADLLQVRWVEARILSERGSPSAVDAADWLVPAVRESGGVEDVVAGFTGAAMAYRSAGRPAEAVMLLSEVDASAHARASPTYPAFLSDMVRTAVAAADVQLADRLVAGVEAMFPHHEHALCASRAILAEARGDAAAAADGYREAARRWEGFGVIVELAHARLGQGRSLLALGRADEAAEPLAAARAEFTRLRATPLASEAASLLARAI